MIITLRTYVPDMLAAVGGVIALASVAFAWWRW